jgi:hypothetical protein
MYLGFSDPTGTVFNGTSLPGALNTAAFQESFLGIDYGPFGAGNTDTISFVTNAPADATSLSDPGSNDWNAGLNWSSGFVPTGTAIFGSSTVTSIDLSGNTSLGVIQILAGAPSYFFNLLGYNLTINYSIINNSSNAATFSIPLDSELKFSGLAPTNTNFVDNGTIVFSNTTSGYPYTFFEGNISGSGGVVQEGYKNTLFLRGNNTYTGGTTPVPRLGPRR